MHNIKNLFFFFSVFFFIRSNRSMPQWFNWQVTPAPQYSSSKYSPPKYAIPFSITGYTYDSPSYGDYRSLGNKDFSDYDYNDGNQNHQPHVNHNKDNKNFNQNMDNINYNQHMNNEKEKNKMTTLNKKVKVEQKHNTEIRNIEAENRTFNELMEKVMKKVAAEDLEDSNFVNDYPAEVPRCDGATFCTKAPNYPYKLLARALKKNKKVEFLNHDDIELDIHSRLDIDSETPLCVATETIIFPQTAETIENEWMFVVNAENTTQSIRVEVCGKPDSACNIIEDANIGYSTYCKQKYIFRTLAALTKEVEIKPILFRFPASCCCNIKLTLSGLYRIGNFKDGISMNDDDEEKTSTNITKP